jgi:hypothetical protein
MTQTNEPNLVSIWYRRAFEALFGLTMLAILFALAVPNLMRSRMAADKAMQMGRLRELHRESLLLDQAAPEGKAQDRVPDRKIVRTVALDVTAKDPRKLSNQATTLAAARSGYVQSSSSEQYLQSERITMIVRLPNSSLEAFVAEVKAQALKVDTEKLDAKDVTAEWVDTDARLRNARREEEQYLAIMKRATSVKDTLEVSNKLSGVRERIEQMEGEQKLLEHQVAMSTVTLTLEPEELPAVSRLIWHPWQNLKIAAVASAQGLADYADTMLAFLFKLPVILLWVVTLLVGALIAIRGLQIVWSRWLRRVLKVQEPAPQS